jgi:hypothetical protein
MKKKNLKDIEFISLSNLPNYFVSNLKNLEENRENMKEKDSKVEIITPFFLSKEFSLKENLNKDDINKNIKNNNESKILKNTFSNNKINYTSSKLLNEIYLSSKEKNINCNFFYKYYYK